jgi:hypothetical protein
MAEALVESFEKDFGETIKGIKMGEPLSRLPALLTVHNPYNVQFQYAKMTQEELRRETTQGSELGPQLEPLAKYLYDSELKMIVRREGLFQEEAQHRTAQDLISLSESLKFLKFDVAREKFNPDSVFMEREVASPPVFQNEPEEKRFILHWRQKGDYWRDERQQYKGILVDRCSG